MKYRITQGENPYNGEATFYVYQIDNSGLSHYKHLFSTHQAATECVHRLLNPKAEILVEEFDA